MDIDAYENSENMQAHKISSQASKPGLSNLKLGHKEETAIFSYHKPTRSRSSHDLEQMLQKFNHTDLLTEVTSGQKRPSSKNMFSKKGQEEFTNALASENKQFGHISAADTNNSLYPIRSLNKLDTDEKKDYNGNDFIRGRPRNKTSDVFESTARTTERNSEHDHKHNLQGSRALNTQQEDYFTNKQFPSTQKHFQSQNQEINTFGYNDWKGIKNEQASHIIPNRGLNREAQSNFNGEDQSLDNIIDIMESNKQMTFENRPFNMNQPQTESVPMSLNLDYWAKPASSFVGQPPSTQQLVLPSSQKEIDLLGLDQPNYIQYQYPNVSSTKPRKIGGNIDDLLSQDLFNLTPQQENVTTSQGFFEQIYGANVAELYSKFGNNTRNENQKMIEAPVYGNQYASPSKPQEPQITTPAYARYPIQPQIQTQVSSSINADGDLQPKLLPNRQPTFDVTQFDFSSPVNGPPHSILEKQPAHTTIPGTGRESFEIVSKFADAYQNNVKLGTSITSRADGIGQVNLCRFHPSNLVSYICIKENCGELLCPLCLYEHQKNKHIGEYEALPSFSMQIKQKLEQAQQSFSDMFEQVKNIQNVLGDKNKFDLRIVEELSQIEMNLVKNVRQFFDSVRQEFSKDIFFDFPKVSEELLHLHQDISTMSQSLADDLSAVSQDISLSNPHLLTRIVQRDYIKSCAGSFNNLNNLKRRVQTFIHDSTDFHHDNKLQLEVNSRIVSELLVLLAENVRIKDLSLKSKFDFSNQPSEIQHQSKFNNFLSPIPEHPPSDNIRMEPQDHPKDLGKGSEGDGKREKERIKSKEDIEEKKEGPMSQRIRHKAAERSSPEEEEDLQRRPRTLSPWKGVVSNTANVAKMINNIGNITPNSLHNTQKSTKNHFEIKKLNEDITNRVLEMYNTGGASPMGKSLGDRDVDASMMRFLLGYMERYYNTNKVRVLEPTFFQKLLSINDALDFSDFARKEFYFDSVADDLQAGLPKGKCIFTSCEKIFMLGKVQASQWILVEIRNNPKKYYSL